MTDMPVEKFSDSIEDISIVVVIVIVVVVSISLLPFRVESVDCYFVLGYQPPSAIACCFFVFLAKLAFQGLLIRDIRSVSFKLTSSVILLILKSNKSCSAFVMEMLKDPFCSFEPPTCRSAVLNGTPKHTTYSSVGVLKYSRKGTSNLLLCPSINSDGLILSSRGMTFNISRVASISTSISEAIFADSFHLITISIILSRYWQTDGPGKYFHTPM